MKILNELPSPFSQAGAIILKMSHGYAIERSYRGARDPLVDLADEALLQFSLAAAPGAWLVDVLPICAFASGVPYPPCLTFIYRSAFSTVMGTRYLLPAHGISLEEDPR